METKFLFLFFFFFISNLFGQNEPRLYKYVQSLNDAPQNEFRIKYIKEYKYDLRGNISEEIKKTYDLDGEITFWTGVFYEYNSDNQLLKETYRRYNQGVNLWITIGWTDREYDVNKCEIEYSYTLNVGGLNFKYEYEKNTDCQLIKESYSKRDFSSGIVRLDYVHERTYFPDGISYQEKKFESFTSSGNSTLKTIRDYYLHSDERLDEIHSTINNQSGGYYFEVKTTYEYDEYENVKSYSEYFKDATITEWELQKTNYRHNEYDDENRLTKTTTEQLLLFTEPPSNNVHASAVFSYEYFCKDLEKIYTVFSTLSGNSTQYESFYEGKDECFDIEKENLEIAFSPNPSNGMFAINSSIFRSGDTQLSVFDMNGRLLLEKKEIRRAENAELNLTNFPDGIYIIQLINQDHFVQNRVVVAK